MQLRNVTSGEDIRSLHMRLTVAEARELRDDLEVLLTAKPSRHEHVSSSDYQTEITVSIDFEGE